MSIETLARQFQAAIDRYGRKFREDDVNRDERGRFADDPNAEEVVIIPDDEAEPEKPAPKDRESAFGDAFREIERKQGHGLVMIHDLRQAMPDLSREEFDNLVWNLRKSGKFTADSSDSSRGKLTPEQKEAGIMEGDSRLVYLSRYSLRALVQAAVERYGKKPKPAKGQGGFTFKEEDHPRDESGQFAEQSSAKSPPQEDEPFQLQPSKQKPKKAEFDDSGKGKQGGLFGLGKGEIKGQGLMFDDHFDPAAALEDSRKEKGKSTLDLPGEKSPSDRLEELMEIDEPTPEQFAEMSKIAEQLKTKALTPTMSGPISVPGKGVYDSETGKLIHEFKPKKKESGSENSIAGMTFEEMAKIASRHGHEYENALENIKKRPSAWVSVVNGWKDQEKAETNQRQRDARKKNWKPNEKQQEVLDFIKKYTGTFTRSADAPMYSQYKTATNALIKKGIIDRTEDGSKIIYTVNRDFNEPEKHSRLTSAFQSAIDRYAASNKSCNWITLKSKSADGDSKGGAKVCIGDNGKITKGPSALKGKKLSSISGPKNAVDDSIRTGAKRFGVRKDDLKAAVDEVMAERMQVAKEQQELKRIAHKRAGIYPSDVEKLINRNLDWTSVKGFDKAAQELPMLDPRFNWPEDEAPERLWEFLREDAVVLPKKTDDDVIAEAGERLRASGTTRGKKREPVPADDDDADYVPFSRFRQDFERELYRRGVVAQN